MPVKNTTLVDRIGNYVFKKPLEVGKTDRIEVDTKHKKVYVENQHGRIKDTTTYTYVEELAYGTEITAGT
jgi:hypothetical protein